MSPPAAIVVHYSEIGLKGKNRGFFVNTLVRNIRRALHGLPVLSVQGIFGRIMVHLDPERGEIDAEAFSRRLRLLPGVANFSFAAATRVLDRFETVLEDDPFYRFMAREAWQVVERSGARSFVVRAKRATKEFPLNSLQLESRMGHEVLQQAERAGHPLRVDLHHPELVVRIEITHPYAFVYGDKEPGVGGLPVGSSGKLVSLMSAGFDSPVASFMMMKRGAQVVFVHFHSYPLTDRSSVEAVGDLVDVLTRVQLHSRLYLVPFGVAQQEIIAKSPRTMRMVIYRRMMMRISSEIARREGALGLLTGESLGQVASQTLSNMAAIDESASLPVYRPLVGLNKDEIIALADHVGTHPVSSEPAADCCSLMVARHPVTKSSLRILEEVEAEFDVPRMVREAVEQAEVVEYDFGAPARDGAHPAPGASERCGRRTVRRGES